MSNVIEHGDKVAFHPGYYVSELVEHIDIHTLAENIGISEETVRLVMDGKMDLPDEMARGLAAYLGTSVSLWQNLGRRFRDLIAEFAEEIKDAVD